jgi:hypothetical protein
LNYIRIQPKSGKKFQNPQKSKKYLKTFLNAKVICLFELLLPLKGLKSTICVLIGFMEAHFSLQNYLESASKRY